MLNIVCLKYIWLLYIIQSIRINRSEDATLIPLYNMLCKCVVYKSVLEIYIYVCVQTIYILKIINKSQTFFLSLHNEKNVSKSLNHILSTCSSSKKKSPFFSIEKGTIIKLQSIFTPIYL